MIESWKTNHCSLGLMRQLAYMAGTPDIRCTRMVLVLDIDDSPRLYTESYLANESYGGVKCLDCNWMDNVNVERCGICQSRNLVAITNEDMVLPKVDVIVEEKSMVIDTTTMQNNKFRTAVPRPINASNGASQPYSESRSLAGDGSQ